ncbi:MAG: AbrB/MazE/SpoVT family DNA-binding domain-containing protein [Proteobacteria bacterium]|nr:AbrB/MazE/SpoVT family DNA-binding domain-containing protein [Pseudomonadota bacterium]
MKRPVITRRKSGAKNPRAAASSPGTVRRRAAIFRNGRNQAVRLPQDLKFPEKVKEVQVRKQGDSILLSPVRPDWPSFFALDVSVPDEFLSLRNDRPPQEREPL